MTANFWTSDTLGSCHSSSSDRRRHRGSASEAARDLERFAREGGGRGASRRSPCVRRPRRARRLARDDARHGANLSEEGTSTLRSARHGGRRRNVESTAPGARQAAALRSSARTGAARRVQGARVRRRRPTARRVAKAEGEFQRRQGGARRSTDAREGGGCASSTSRQGTPPPRRADARRVRARPRGRRRSKAYSIGPTSANARPVARPSAITSRTSRTPRTLHEKEFPQPRREADARSSQRRAASSRSRRRTDARTTIGRWKVATGGPIRRSRGSRRHGDRELGGSFRRPASSTREEEGPRLDAPSAPS
jgi:hypothetical protein